MKLSKFILPWIIWGIAAFGVAYQFMLQGSTSVMIPQLMRDFSINISDISFLSASFVFTYILLQIPSGLLVDKFGPRLLVIIGFAFCAAACLIFAQAEVYSVAVTSRLIMGVVTAPMVVCTLYLASTWFPPKRFALIAGLTELLGMLGGAMGAEGLAVSVEHVGWRTTMLFCALVGLGMAVMAFLFVKEREQQIPTRLEKISVITKLKKVISIPQVWINGIFSGLLFVIISAYASLWCIPHMQALYDIELAKAGAVAAMLFIGAGVGSPILGWLSDYMGRRKPLMIAGAAAALLLSLLVFYLPNIPLWTMFVLLFTLGFVSSVYMIPYAVVREITPASVRGTAMGVINMLAIAFGAPLLQPLIGWFLQHSVDNSIEPGSDIISLEAYQSALFALPASIALALILVFFVKETYCKEA